MDEQLLKRSVQSIEMPDEMKERIIASCKSGEAKPLILPKKRFVYMPMAVTACICILVTALVGVGIWRLGAFSSGGDITTDPEATDDYELAGMAAVSLPEIKEGVSVGVSYYPVDGYVKDCTIQGEDTNLFKAWLEGLRCSKQVEYEQVEIGDLYIFRVPDEDGAYTGGGEIGYYVSGYLGIGDYYYLVENPSDPPAAIVTSEPPMSFEQLTLDKLREICSGDPSKLSWSDFENFKSTTFGSGLLYLEYDIEGKYTLTICGNPNIEPYYMEFAVPGQYYSIDIREDSIEEYLNEPIPDGDVINIIPITWDDINDGVYSDTVEFIAGDEVPMTDEQLSSYYGIDITDFSGIPSDMVLYAYKGTPSMTERHIWKENGGTGYVVYYDMNAFYYATPDGSGSIMISVATLPDYIEKLHEDKKMCSRIGGRIVFIGQTEDGHYEAELLSADSVLGIGVSADGITLEELCDVISALVEKTEVRDCVNEDYPYPWDYIDSITAVADVPAADGKLIWPTDGGYVSEWGYWDGGYAGHKGIDISGIDLEDPVFAGADGVVTYADWYDGLGYYVEIYHPDLGISSGYAHNSTLYVSVGQQVAQGERIAGAGESGLTNGVSIHFSVKVNGENVNPKDYLSLPAQ